MAANFVHLRVHTQYSVGEGTLFVNKIPGMCAAANMPACAITDTNLMSGAPEFSDSCKSTGVQPIIGITITLNHHSIDPGVLRADQMSKIVLLAQNQTGYLNLTRLNSLMYMRKDNQHLGAFIKFDELAAHSDGLICLSGAHAGPLGHAILNIQDNLARDYAKKFQSIFGNRFYMEIQRHGLESEIKTEPVFLDIAKDLDIPLVATNDVCFARPDNYEAADALGCVLQQTKIIDPDRSRKNVEQYFKSDVEMCEIFSDLPEATDNTIQIALRCSYVMNTGRAPLLPRFGDNFEAECQMLRADAISGLKRRMAENKVPEADQKKYFEQAEFECDVIIKMGFPGYFLIVADYINWCVQADIAVGPGRGSGAGSVVAWALGITKVDPLQYGLLFERFLNPDRISMPDFDIDFEPDGIARVLNYICQRYGDDHICRIITFGSLQARGAIRDIGRVFGMPRSKIDRFAKLIPNDAKNIADAIKISEDIQESLNDDSDLEKVVNVSKEVEGTYRNLGQHACGIVIGDRPTTDVAPIYRDPVNDMPSCQFDGHFLESVGLIKFDFLGLETLAILKYAANLIKQNHGLNINIDFIPLNDAKTFQLWQSGKTVGIFQFDANHVQQILKKMKPKSFAEISALNALNRPGPMAFIPQFIARMHGEEDVSYVHPKAEEVLKETYGIIVYQEQVMQLTRTLAGFTRGESDNVRKAMGKKIIKMMDELEVKFIDGCERMQTLNASDAKDLWEKFKEFAKYAFNKSHAVAYSIIANQCAYLKANYTAEFLAASMSSNAGDTDQLALHVDDARNNFGIEVLPPNINTSDAMFTVKDGKILYGLAAVKGIGKLAVDPIIAERESNGKFKNLTDFAKRTAGMLNKRVLEAMAKVGALDSLCPNRAQIFMNADTILMYSAKQKDSVNSLSLFANTVEDDVSENRLMKSLNKTAPWSFGETLANELAAFGFYISAHPIDQYKNIIKRCNLTTSETLSAKPDRANVQIAVCVNSFNKRFTKTGKQMISINAADSFGNIDAVAFGDACGPISEVFRNDTMVLLCGRVSVKDENRSLFVDSAEPLSKWISGAAKKIILDVRDQKALPDVKKILDGLPAGKTRVVLNIKDGTKTASLALQNGIVISPTFTADMNAVGVKVTME